MVNPVNLMLVVQLAQLLGKLLRGICIAPKRLFHNQSYPVFGIGPTDAVAVALQATTDDWVDCRRKREVVQPAEPASTALLLPRFHGHFKSLETIIRVVRARHVRAARQKGVNRRLIRVLALEQKGRQPLSQRPVREIRPRISNDAQAFR